ALLDLPTGTGKTATIDIAVFLLALLTDRPQPRRIVFVVDRRVIVHQAARRAGRIADQLRTSDDPVVVEVARRLRALGNLGAGDAPLVCAELRGGIMREDDWVRRPDQPAVIVSTVDQVGSRLLFRGYGVSPGMRPVHAGLLGNDTLYLLDEVHLARPFADTLRAIGDRYRPPADVGVPDRWAVVELSATPSRPVPPDRVFTLQAEDRDPDRAAVLARRLAASKPARTHLLSLRGAAPQRRASLAIAAGDHACELLDHADLRTVAVVVNPVDTALAVHRHVEHARPDIRTVLLTGRMRPLDRDRILGQIEPRLRTGRNRADTDLPTLVIATQSLEAGADFDLDALVTECAPLDALIQRFGRVDRDGQLSAHQRSATSVILAVSSDLEDDPIYGDRIARTWAWLSEQKHPDFGVDRLRVSAQDRHRLSSPSPRAPQLMPSHLDRWAQTSITPDADPDPSQWLHGVQDSSSDVSVIWRADLLPESLAAADPVAARQATALVALCPPGNTEAMQVPVRAVRAWLATLAGQQNVPTPSITDTASQGHSDDDLAPPEVLAPV
ncbi:MAG TPA: type I-U CRISPR-associated helicase/endonuclease Cas3, partial [Pseudonocardiaceae bacterium]